jgi:mannose-6-phosphate isomerase-like protein (cupin superfamily)
MKNSRAVDRGEHEMSPPAALSYSGQAEVQLPCADLAPTLEFFVGRLGFRIESIFPAEDPTVASLSGHGLRLRLAPGEGDPGLIRLPRRDPGPADERMMVAPNGTRIELTWADPPVEIPLLREEFLVTRREDGPGASKGRAGMVYRDLIPGRLGGRFIASHIAIAQGGPVADWTHFHKIAFQLIFCRRGWVRLVYEDQGEPFIMESGDCVLQPPRIRHRVLESSSGLEVIEVTCPALHETLADHDLVLPTGRPPPGRDFAGQVFLRHVASKTPWIAHGETGFERRETGVGQASGGLVDARVLRPAGATTLDAPAHQGELLFGVVLDGAAVLECRGKHPLSACDAFVIPAGEAWGLRNCEPDLALLEIMAPADH